MQGRVQEVLQGSGPRIIGLAGEASLSEPAPSEAEAGGALARCWGVMLSAAADGRADVILGQEEGDDWDSGSLAQDSWSYALTSRLSGVARHRGEITLSCCSVTILVTRIA